MEFSTANITKMKEMYEKGKDNGVTFTSIGKVFGVSRKIVARLLKDKGMIAKPSNFNQPIAVKAEHEKPKININEAKLVYANISDYNEIANLIAKIIPDISSEIVAGIRRKIDIEFVGLPNGKFTNNCIYDGIFESIIFFRTKHELFAWYKEHIKQAIGKWEDELSLIQLYIHGRRVYPSFETHIVMDMKNDVRESIIFRKEF